MHMVKFSFDGKSCLEGFLGAKIFGAFFGGISNWESQSGTFDQLTSLFGTGAARKLLTLSAQNFAPQKSSKVAILEKPL